MAASGIFWGKSSEPDLAKDKEGLNIDRSNSKRENFVLWDSLLLYICMVTSPGHRCSCQGT